MQRSQQNIALALCVIRASIAYSEATAPEVRCQPQRKRRLGLALGLANHRKNAIMTCSHGGPLRQPRVRTRVETVV